MSLSSIFSFRLHYFSVIDKSPRPYDRRWRIQNENGLYFEYPNAPGTIGFV